MPLVTGNTTSSNRGLTGGRLKIPTAPTYGPYPTSAATPYGPAIPTTPTFSQGDFVPTGASNTTVPGALPPSVLDPGDYASAIEGDSLYQLAKRQRDTEHEANLASLRGAEQTALARFGEIPDAIGGRFGFDLTGAANDETRSLASQNTTAGLSTVAQLNRQRDDQRRSIINALAARGGLRSGDFGFQSNRLQDAYGKAQYDARNALMDYLSGLYSGYSGNENNSYQSLLGAMNSAIQRELNRQAQLAAAPRGGGQPGAGASGNPAGAGPGQPSNVEPEFRDPNYGLTGLPSVYTPEQAGLIQSQPENSLAWLWI